ncbi:hypothetical protein MMC25_004033 [Agyrium rufum]|nr:hypothetical protein [Agyrium rufum]
MWAFDRETVLHYGEPRNVEMQLVRASWEFAVLGYLDVARRLISLLNRHTPDHYEHEGSRLWLAWVETNDWPVGELEKVDEPFADPAKPYPENFELEINGRKHNFTADSAGFRKLLEAIEELDKDQAADSTRASSAVQRSEGLVRALELASVLSAEGRREENLPSVRDILNRIAKRMHCDQQVEDLTGSAIAWKILKDGVLAKAIGVQDSKVRQFAQEVEETFTARYTLGRQTKGTTFELPMPEILNLCSENTLSNPGAIESNLEMNGPWGEDDSSVEGENEDEDEDLKQQRIEKETPVNLPDAVLYAPASSEDIAELEKRLNVTLPADYKEFLHISNGLGSTWGGILFEPPLHPTKDVKWLKKEEEGYLTDIPLAWLPEWHPLHFPRRDGEEWVTVGSVIELGTEDIDSVWLLPPETVARRRDAYIRHYENEAAASCGQRMAFDIAVQAFAGSREAFDSMEWCVLAWTAGGGASLTAYPSFKAFLAEKAWASGRERDDFSDLPEENCFSYKCR